jgi:hypothetical protein
MTLDYKSIYCKHLKDNFMQNINEMLLDTLQVVHAALVEFSIPLITGAAGPHSI